MLTDAALSGLFYERISERARRASSSLGRILAKSADLPFLALPMVIDIVGLPGGKLSRYKRTCVANNWQPS